jgi:Tfp pilus assembly protein PilF
MARVSRETGQAMAARGFVQRYLGGTGPTPEALMLGIEIEMGLGNSQAAADYLQTMRNKFPDSPEVMQARQKLRQ